MLGIGSFHQSEGQLAPGQGRCIHAAGLISKLGRIITVSIACANWQGHNRDSDQVGVAGMRNSLVLHSPLQTNPNHGEGITDDAEIRSEVCGLLEGYS